MADEAKTLEEQIDEMIEDGPVSEEVQDEPIEDEPTEEISEEAAEEPEEPEEPEQPEQSEESVPTEGEVEEEVEEQLEEVEEDTTPDEQEVDEVNELRDRMNKMAEAALRQGIQLPADLLGIEDEVDTQEAPSVQQPVVQQPIQPTSPSSYEDFKILMDGVEFDDFMDNEEKFTSGMRNILSQHEQMLSQRFMSAIPSIIQNQVNQTTSLQRAVDDFYSRNEDLMEVRPTVGAVANQIQARHPDWDVNRVMVESAKTTRKLLRMPSPSVAKRGSKVVRPSFAKPGRTQQRNKPKPKMSKLQMEIDDLLEE